MHLVNMMLAIALFMSTMVFSMTLPTGIILERDTGLEGSGYPITSKMMVRGFIDGHYVERNGSIQEVFTRVAKELPKFNIEAYLAQVQARDNQEYSPEKRSKAGPPYCYPVPGQPWTPAAVSDIEAGINYLNAISSNGVMCGVGPGPKNCVGVACGGSGAIVWCNDCSGGGRVCGQEFDTGGWNVYLTEANCP